MVKSMSDGPIGGKLLYVDRDSQAARIHHRDLPGLRRFTIRRWMVCRSRSSRWNRSTPVQDPAGLLVPRAAQGAQNLAQKGILPPPSLKLVLCAQDVVDVTASFRRRGKT